MQKFDKKILTVQDLSCAGQCSLTVAHPILSAFGLETVILPTAILSEHTMFKNFTFLDLAEEMKKILASWQADEHRFTAVYTGYLGKKEHFAIVEKAIDELTEENAFVAVDPAFGDNGKLYPLFDMEYVEGMKKFMQKANVILPNHTEACFLTGREYQDKFTCEEVKSLMSDLSKLGNFDVMLTGVEEDNQIGFAYYNHQTGEIKFYLRPCLDGRFHGTGDIFASVFVGAYMSGKTAYEAGVAAAEFVAQSIAANDKEHFYGVQFEKILASFASQQLKG